MNVADQVADFDTVGNGGDLEVHYATALELIHHVMPRTPTSVLDIGSGTGRFALWLYRYFHCQIHGIDLSPRMVECANANIKNAGANREVTFEIGCAGNLDHLEDESFDVTTCTLAAHHFPSIDDVANLLVSLDRLTTARGAVLLYDLGRLKTKWQVERYCKVFGRPDLKHYSEDFLNSMFASFTPHELAAAIPQGSKRSWVHLVEPMCQGIQAVVGFTPDRSYRPEPLPHFPDLPRELFAGYRQLSGSFLRQLGRRQRELANKATTVPAVNQKGIGRGSSDKRGVPASAKEKPVDHRL
jgi:ubiquinone/menaquinone biosynthesis C-methylase UbiE